MAYTSATFGNYVGAPSADYDGAAFNATFVDAAPAPQYIVDNNVSATFFSVGDSVTFYYNASMPGVPATYLGYYLEGTTEYPLVSYNNSDDYLLGQSVIDTTYPIVEAPYTQGSSSVCFAAGTLIRTARGDVAVEHLAIGDRVVTASGAHRPIRWLGHRSVDCRRATDRTAVLPVRIAAGAFGPGKPERDLFVSPGHAVCVPAMDEVLIPASVLINGATVAQADVDTITYWHVELESHDILLANGLQAESFIDVGNRAFFAESQTVAFGLTPDAPARTLDDYCRPFFDGGPLIDAVRDRMRHRARVLGWSLGGDVLGGLHLVVDAVRIEPRASGQTVCFLVPAGAQDVWLISDVSVPYDTSDCPDRRELGVCIATIGIDDGLGIRRTISIDDPRLGAGFRKADDSGHRWTDGRAQLPQELWQGCQGWFFLRVDLAMGAPMRWVAPSREATSAEAVRQAA